MEEIPLFESNMQNIFHFSFTQTPFLSLILPYHRRAPIFGQQFASLRSLLFCVCEREMGEERESEERGGEEEVVVVEGDHDEGGGEVDVATRQQFTGDGEGNREAVGGGGQGEGGGEREMRTINSSRMNEEEDIVMDDGEEGEKKKKKRKRKGSKLDKISRLTKKDNGEEEEEDRWK